jgi:osomolarity two-component system response regulator SSK1
LEGLGGSALPPSPLALSLLPSDNVEYFSATAQKLGNSPSSGVVIQSPDRQTAGIYFHLRGNNGSRKPSSSNIVEKEKIRVGPTPPR